MALKDLIGETSEYEKKPVFLSEHWGFTITFPNVNYSSENGSLNVQATSQTDTITDTINDTIKLSETEISVLDLIKKDCTLTRESLSAKTGLSDSTIARVLKNLQEKGILFREGSRKKGKWRMEK